MTIIAVSLSGCSARSTPTTVDPDVASAAVARTAPDRPLRVVFAWRAQQRDARFSGRGVARIESPYRARLDLFGPRGDGYLSAALIGSEIRLPAGAQAVGMPPPPLMWAVLGVVRPPEDARLIGTRVTDDDVELHYDRGGDRLVYVLRAGRLLSAEWRGPSVHMSVKLSGKATGLPAEAVYRDLSGYAELMLNVESVDEVDPYPPEIWVPGV